MHLKGLELSGFKSFAKKTAIDFNVPITAIVGPNGSGKSNIAEAFRFVLGEQSMKSLRGKRGEDLIFNGSKTIQKMNRASVKLTFDNRARFFPLELDEITLERAVHRDGINEYLINGSSVRLRDILELLSSANIGASGHHIISQGEADRLLNASLKERREMIEEALGLKLYQYKREESERKLLKTEENIAQVGSLRKEIAPHLAFLGKQAEKVKKGEAMREEFREKAKEYLRREEIYLAFEKKDINEEKQGPSLELSEAEKKISRAKETLSSSSEKSFQGEILSAEKEYRETKDEEESIRFNLGRIEGELSSERKSLDRLKRESEKKEAIPYEEIESFSHECNCVREEAEHEEDISKLRHIIRSLSDKLHTLLSKRNSSLSGEAEMLGKEVFELEAKKKSLEHEYGEAREKSKITSEKLENLGRRSREATETLRESEKEIFSLLSRKNELVALLSSLRTREEMFLRDKANFDEEIKEIQALGGLEAIRISHYEIITDGRALSEPEIAGESRSEQEERRKRLERMKIRLEEFGGGSGEEVLKEFDEAKARDEFLLREVEDLQRSAESLKELILDLTEKLRSEFSAGIAKINTEFKNYFSLMFGGGTASIDIQKIEKRRVLLNEEEMEMDSDEEKKKVEEGIEISVSLPHKRIKGLEMLSGGERALTSIALLFAISQVNPPPFVILDETDAALDEANSRKYGDMIENLSANSELILITHNRETMSRAGVLYGVTMGSDAVSKLLSVRFDEAVAVVK
ncbi:MAG: AAA family ATPase [Patescibacteria group bacterium]